MSILKLVSLLQNIKIYLSTTRKSSSVIAAPHLLHPDSTCKLSHCCFWSQKLDQKLCGSTQLLKIWFWQDLSAYQILAVQKYCLSACIWSFMRFKCSQRHRLKPMEWGGGLDRNINCLPLRWRCCTVAARWKHLSRFNLFASCTLSGFPIWEFQDFRMQTFALNTSW